VATPATVVSVKQKVRDLGQRAAGEAVEDRGRLGALHGDQRGGVGDVLEIDSRRSARASTPGPCRGSTR
jgi:hypothetical protein